MENVNDITSATHGMRRETPGANLSPFPCFETAARATRNLKKRTPHTDRPEDDTHVTVPGVNMRQFALQKRCVQAP